MSREIKHSHLGRIVHKSTTYMKASWSVGRVVEWNWCFCVTQSHQKFNCAMWCSKSVLALTSTLTSGAIYSRKYQNNFYAFIFPSSKAWLSYCYLVMCLLEWSSWSPTAKNITDEEEVEPKNLSAWRITCTPCKQSLCAIFYLQRTEEHENGISDQFVSNSSAVFYSGMRTQAAGAKNDGGLKIYFPSYCIAYFRIKRQCNILNWHETHAIIIHILCEAVLRFCSHRMYEKGKLKQNKALKLIKCKCMNGIHS